MPRPPRKFVGACGNIVTHFSEGRSIGNEDRIDGRRNPLRGAEIYPSRSHDDIDDDLNRVEQNEEVISSKDCDQMMKHDQNRLALTSVEQERGWPSRIGTRVRSKYSADVRSSFSVVLEMLDRVRFGSTFVSKRDVRI